MGGVDYSSEGGYGERWVYLISCLLFRNEEYNYLRFIKDIE